MSAPAADAADWPPLIIAVAPNGARRTKADHPALPMTPDEIARDAAACLDAGACMVHLHVRDRQGRHTLDVEAYREATVAIRRAVGERMIVQATSEAAGLYRAEEQMAMVQALRPEAVSLALRELVPDGHEKAAGKFFAWLAHEGILAQYILYSSEDVVRFAELRRQGVIPADTAFVLYVLGRYNKAQVSHPGDLLPFLAAAGGEGCHWAFCAFGAREGAAAMMVAALGGHVRVGFENNLWLNDGRLAPDNAALVAQVAAGAGLLARPLADADGARSLFAVRPPLPSLVAGRG